MSQITSSLSGSATAPSLATQDAPPAAPFQDLSASPSGAQPEDQQEVQGAHASVVPFSESQPQKHSLFHTNTVEVVLHLLPEDSHPQGRRVRYTLAIGGKTLVVGGKRLNVLVEQLAASTQEGTEQLLERVEQYAATRQQQIQQTQAGSSSRVTSRAIAVPRPHQPAPSQTQEQPQQLSLF